MKLRSFLASAAFALMALVSGNADAAAFPTIGLDLGTVAADDSGIISNTFKLTSDRFQDYSFIGSLEGKSRITFDYTLSGQEESYLESALGTLGSSVSPPSVVTHIADDKMSGQVVLSNFASVAANFTSFFHAFLATGKNTVNVTYSVSAVPLPAALPLFGSGLAGLAFLARRKKVSQKT